MTKRDLDEGRVRNDVSSRDVDNANIAVEASVSKRKRKRKRKKNSHGDDTSKEKDTPVSVNEKAGNDSNAANEVLARTVYVEGISFDSNEEELRSFFEENDVSDIVEMRLPTWQDTGRLRGFGHIVFKSEDSSVKALALDGSYPNNRKRYLTIRKAKPPKVVQSYYREQPDGCRRIFIKNLPYECTEEDVSLALVDCGKIIEGGVRLVQNSVTKQFKGFAYVEFKNAEGAAAAVKKAAKPFGLCVQGRPLFVDYDENKMKGSYRTSAGKLWTKEH